MKDLSSLAHVIKASEPDYTHRSQFDFHFASASCSTCLKKYVVDSGKLSDETISIGKNA